MKLEKLQGFDLFIQNDLIFTILIVAFLILSIIFLTIFFKSNSHEILKNISLTLGTISLLSVTILSFIVILSALYLKNQYHLTLNKNVTIDDVQYKSRSENQRGSKYYSIITFKCQDKVFTIKEAPPFIRKNDKINLKIDEDVQKKDNGTYEINDMQNIEYDIVN